MAPRSTVWSFFEEVDATTNKAMCLLCKKKIAFVPEKFAHKPTWKGYAGQRHLESQHSKEWEERGEVSYKGDRVTCSVCSKELQYKMLLNHFRRVHAPVLDRGMLADYRTVVEEEEKFVKEEEKFDTLTKPHNQREDDEPEHCIYGLREHGHDKVCYFGRTQNPERRLRQHNRNPKLTSFNDLELVPLIFGFNETIAKLVESLVHRIFSGPPMYVCDTIGAPVLIDGLDLDVAQKAVAVKLRRGLKSAGLDFFPTTQPREETPCSSSQSSVSTSQSTTLSQRYECVYEALAREVAEKEGYPWTTIRVDADDEDEDD